MYGCRCLSHLFLLQQQEVIPVGTRETIQYQPPPLSWIVAFESITFLGSNYLDPKRSANFWQHFPSRELKSTLYWQGFAINTMRKDARP